MSRTLWGVPVMVSTSMSNGTALLGDFKGSAKLFYTGQPRLDWSENTYDSVAGASDFERNTSVSGWKVDSASRSCARRGS